MTSAEAQAFKRACSCFGLGRYFYDFDAPWVDIDDKGRPKKAPALASWMVPENWRKGQRPSEPNTTPVSSDKRNENSRTAPEGSRLIGVYSQSSTSQSGARAAALTPELD